MPLGPLLTSRVAPLVRRPAEGVEPLACVLRSPLRRRTPDQLEVPPFPAPLARRRTPRPLRPPQLDPDT